MLSKENNIDKIEKSSQMLKAIAHPTRIKILQMLKDAEEHSVTDIYLGLECEQATISHHLIIMKDKGVLKSRRKGKNTFYSIKKDAFVDCINLSSINTLSSVSNN
jgi:DNA-binding transcriptional ArsR family regulator